MHDSLPKSKRYIRKAFLQLLEKKDFQKITVKNIIDQADIGRSTFYIHYNDKYELLGEIEDDLISGFVAVLERLRNYTREAYRKELAKGYFPLYAEYFRYIKKNGDAFNILLNSKSGTNFSSKFSNAIERSRRELTKLWDTQVKQSTSDSFLDYREAILSAVYVSMITTWLKHRMDYTEEQMGHMLTRFYETEFFSTELFAGDGSLNPPADKP